MKRPPRSAFPERPDQMSQPTDAVRSSEARSKPVRVTVDLDPDDYDTLREFAFGARMTHADVLRSLVRLLASQPISDLVRTVPGPLAVVSDE